MTRMCCESVGQGRIPLLRFGAIEVTVDIDHFEFGLVRQGLDEMTFWDDTINGTVSVDDCWSEAYVNSNYTWGLCKDVIQLPLIYP